MSRRQNSTFVNIKNADDKQQELRQSGVNELSLAKSKFLRWRLNIGVATKVKLATGRKREEHAEAAEPAGALPR